MLMSKGEPYRRIESWSDKEGFYTDHPPSTHGKAPLQPEYGTFEGFNPFDYY